MTKDIYHDKIYENWKIPRWEDKDREGNGWYIMKRYDELSKEEFATNKLIIELAVHKKYINKLKEQEKELMWIRFIAVFMFIIIIALTYSLV